MAKQKKQTEKSAQEIILKAVLKAIKQNPSIKEIAFKLKVK